MKKYILLSFFLLLSIKNYSQTLVPKNQYLLTDYAGFAAPEVIDSNLNTPILTNKMISCKFAGGFYDQFYYYGEIGAGDYMIIDLQKEKLINQLKFINLQGGTFKAGPFATPSYLQNVNFSFNIQTGPTPLGPWTTALNTTTINNVTSSSNYSSPSINKVSRYWKINFSDPPSTTYGGTGGQICPNFTIMQPINFNEIEFYENNNFITSSMPSVLLNNQCTTLTASAAGETYLWSTGETTQSISVCNTGTYTCTVTNTAFVGNQDHTASINITKLGTQDNLPGPNGEIYSIYKNGNTVYMGGDFNSFGPITGSGALIDNGTGIANTTLPRVDGTINSTVSDGNGGWYIGGAFTRVGNYSINNLAHIKSDNTVDLNFKPEPNNAVYTLLLDGTGTSLYAGGAFTTLKTLANNYLSKIDAATGDPLFWNANVNGVVRSIQFYADQIIVGGSFTSLGGAARTNLGAVDTTFVQATTWTPNPNNIVYKAYISGTKLYVGGDFTTISGVSKSRGAGYTLPAFTTDGYDMGANGRIHDFIVNNSVLYASGLFTIIGGANRNYIAGLSPLNAIANTFNPAPDGVVNTMAVSVGNLIVGGAFSNIGTAVRNRIAALSFANGTATSWNPNVSGLIGSTFNVNTLAAAGNSIYAGGIFYSVGGSVRNNVAAIDAATGLLSSWDANANNIVRAVYADNNYVYLGGDFTTVNGTILKNRIAQINVSNSLPTGWNPNADGSVSALTLNGTTLYAGGAFANIGGAARSKIAALNTTTGAATAFNPTVNGNVNALAISGDALYIGGAFTTIGGQTRNRIASYIISTGTLSTLDPNADNTVNAVAVTNNKLYIGGTFANVSGLPRVNFAEYEIATNLLTTTNTYTTTSSGLNALFAVNDAVYSGGGYQLSNQGNPINNSSVLKISGASIGYWQPQPDDIIRTIFASNDKVYLGGRFKNVLSRYQPYFASTDVYVSSGAAPSITSLSSNTLCAGETLTVTGTGFVGVSLVTIGGASVSYAVVSDTLITIVLNSALSGTVVITNPIGSAASVDAITVNITPAATASAQTFCNTATAASLVATGTLLKWYATSSGGTVLASATALTNGTYYVTQTLNACESATRTAVAVTVNVTPTATASAQTFCNAATAAALIATGTSIKWYADSSGGTALASATALATRTYYVTQTLNACESATRTAVAVTVNITPAATASAQTFCDAATAASLIATGTSLKWYAASSGGIALASAAVLATGTYYVTQTLNACESATRTAVAVTINVTPAATASAQTFCNAATVASLVATGTSLKWYATSSGGTALASATALATGTYYITQTLNACESATRTAVVVTVNVTPAATASAQTFCNSATIADLIATGTSIKWYAASSGGTALANATALATGTYYVTQTLNACESATRTAVAVTINVTPAATSSAQTFCNAATVASLVATGTSLKWYAASSGGTALASATALATGTYYVTQTLNACESATRTALAVIINVTPAATASAQTFCNAATVASLVATGTSLKWYAASSGGTALASATALATGTYYVTQTLNACESATRTAVAVTINVTPAATASAQTFCNAATAAALIATGTSIKWYTASSGGTALTSATALTTGTYYVTQTLNACESATRTAVAITVNITPAATAAAQNFCNTATATSLVATGTSIKWYVASSGGTALLSSTALTTGTYYVTQTLNACESATRTAVAVTVNITPAATAFAQTFCNSATAAALIATGTSLKWYAASSGGTALSSATALATGTYYVTQTLNACESTTRTAVAVTINITPAPVGTSPQNLIGGQTLANIQVTGTGIIWYASLIDATNYSNPLPISTILLNATTYYANQTLIECTSINSLAVTVTLTPTLATNTFENSDFKFYPNPVENIFNFECDKKIVSLFLVNMSGQVVIKKKINHTSGQVDLSSIPSGSYILKLFSENSESTVKLIKK